MQNGNKKVFFLVGESRKKVEKQDSLIFYQISSADSTLKKNFSQTIYEVEQKQGIQYHEI